MPPECPVGPRDGRGSGEEGERADENPGGKSSCCHCPAHHAARSGRKPGEKALEWMKRNGTNGCRQANGTTVFPFAECPIGSYA